MRAKHPAVCSVCGRTFERERMLPAAVIRQSVADAIRAQHPNWTPDGFVCHDDLAIARSAYIQDLLEREKGDLTSLENEVMRSMKEHELLSSNVVVEFEENLTLGNRLSDRLAAFGGSWRFLIIFGVVMTGWIGVNAWFGLKKPFDPFPFILLNLVLSCIAAIQAPVIMMSQNRQEAKDRRRAEHDYQINLKAELEIRHLHEKIDHVLSRQWERLIEIQQLQVDLLNEMGRGRDSGGEHNS